MSKASIGSKVIIKSSDDTPKDLHDYAHAIGVVIEVPTLFAEQYEVELDATFNFMKLALYEHEFELLDKPLAENFYASIQKQRKSEGLCPQCGKKGHFSHFAFCCPQHGEY